MTHSPLHRRSLYLRLRVASPATVACYCRYAATHRYCYYAAAHRYCLHSSSTFQKKKRANPHAGWIMKTSPHFVCGAGQPGPYFAGICEARRLALPPLNIIHQVSYNFSNHQVSIKIHNSSFTCQTSTDSQHIDT